MSNYIPKSENVYTQRIIDATIRNYPRLCAELAAVEDGVLNDTPVKQVSVKAGSVGNSTESKAMKLSSNRMMEMQRKRVAVKKCLDLLPPQYHSVICFRYWGVPSAEIAIEKAKKGKPLRGLPFESAFMPTVGDKTNKGRVWTWTIVKSFALSVGEELGEL